MIATIGKHDDFCEREAVAVAGDLGQVRSVFDPREPERYREDVPNAQVYVRDADHFALDTPADEIAAPKGRRQTEGLVQLHRELEVAYCRLMTISTDNISQTNEYRTGVAVPL